MAEKRQSTQKGVFVTFEGPEGGGKSTQARLLADDLRRRGYEVLVTREPGGTDLGEEVRRITKEWQGNAAPCDESELLLMAAARAQHVTRVIAPALSSGQIVISDRFLDSTTVYQGGARGLDCNFVQRLHAFSVGNFVPDITFVLDVSEEVGNARVSDRSATAQSRTHDRFEAASEGFHRKVRDGFQQLCSEEPDRMKRIDADCSESEVHEEIVRQIGDVLKAIP